MKSNILFKVYKDTLSIDEIKEDTDLDALNNTTVLNTKELQFTYDYILENKELVVNFLSVVLIKNNTSVVKIKKMSIAPLIISLLNNWENINRVIFTPDTAISMDLFFSLLDCRYIKEIVCYEIQQYLIDRLDEDKGIKVSTRHEIDNVSDFMKDNEINSFSDIYYLRRLTVDSSYKNKDLEDFKGFIKMNRKLKEVRIIHFTKELFDMVFEEIKNSNKTNVTIIINQRDNDVASIVETINENEKKYRKLLNANKLKIKVNYSDEYIGENFFPQLNSSIIHFVFYIIFICSFSLILYLLFTK